MSEFEELVVKRQLKKRFSELICREKEDEWNMEFYCCVKCGRQEKVDVGLIVKSVMSFGGIVIRETVLCVK